MWGGGGGERGRARQPTWQVWQQVTESQPERYRVSETVLQSLEGTEALSRNQAGTRFPEMGPRAEAQ